MIRLDMSNRKLRVKEVFMEMEMIRSNLISNYFSWIIIFLLVLKEGAIYYGKNQKISIIYYPLRNGPLFFQEKPIMEKVTSIHSDGRRVLKKSPRWMQDNPTS